jgi:hypothetical protein
VGRTGREKSDKFLFSYKIFDSPFILLAVFAVCTCQVEFTHEEDNAWVWWHFVLVLYCTWNLNVVMRETFLDILRNGGALDWPKLSKVRAWQWGVFCWQLLIHTVLILEHLCVCYQRVYWRTDCLNLLFA